MAKLTKPQAKHHAEAEKILTKDRLSDDDRLFVIEHWQESAHYINSIAGAFFTPWGLARDLSIEVPAGRIIDLCAGMGTLSLACLWRHRWSTSPVSEIVCVEANPDYAAVGRKLLPDARWVVGDVFALPSDLGRFDTAIGNPPFGNVSRTARSPRYKGAEFERHVIDLASDIADYGVFIVPQMTAGFRYSGCPAGGWSETVKDGLGSGYSDAKDERCLRFTAQTSIVLEPNCGIDTGIYRNDWHGVSVATEVVTVDFEVARAARATVAPDLFASAA